MDIKATQHIYIDDQATVRLDGRVIGSGEDIFTNLLKAPPSPAYRHIVVTKRDQEWRFDAPFRFPSLFLAVERTEPTLPTYLDYVRREQSKTPAERQREQAEAEAKRKEAEEAERQRRLSAPLDTTLDPRTMWLPEYTLRADNDSVAPFEFTAEILERNAIELVRPPAGMTSSQVYLPGEVREKDSRYTRGTLTINRKKSRVPWIFALVAILGVAGIFGYDYLTRGEPVGYTQLCYDMRTGLVADIKHCKGEADQYHEGVWVLSDEADVEPLSELPESADLAEPTGHVELHHINPPPQ